MKILMSSARFDKKQGIDHINFSYGVVETSFYKVLERDVEHVYRPEFLSIKSEEPKKIHLIFRKFRDIRTINGAKNISIISWEFDEIQTHSTNQEGPFYNQKNMMKMMDEVWVASLHLKKVLKRNGIENIHFIPCAIDMNIFRPLGATELVSELAFVRCHNHSEELEVQNSRLLQKVLDKKVFVSVFNPFDKRKNAQVLIRGFLKATANSSDAVLVVKLNMGKSDFSVAVSQLGLSEEEILSPKVIFLTEFLTENQLAALYSLSDYYLCTSKGEGQNLPILEAMSCGVVPVSVNNTAMKDYVFRFNSFVIPSVKRPVPTGLKVCFHNIPNLTWYECSIGDVEKAVSHALAATDFAHKIKSCISKLIVRLRYSNNSIKKKVKRRLRG